MTSKEIKKWLKNNKRNLRWLAYECNINYNTLYACMNGLFKFSDENINKIKKIIK